MSNLSIAPCASGAKHLVVVAGHPGAGTFARELAERTGWPVLDQDTPLVGAMLRAGGRRGDVPLAQVDALVGAARFAPGAVVAAPLVAELADDQWRDGLEARCETAGILLTVVWVDPPRGRTCPGGWAGPRLRPGDLRVDGSPRRVAAAVDQLDRRLTGEWLAAAS